MRGRIAITAAAAAAMLAFSATSAVAQPIKTPVPDAPDDCSSAIALAEEEGKPIFKDDPVSCPIFK